LLPAIALLLLAVSACGDKPATGWSGYAEGDYVYVSAPLAGRLESLAVQPGQTVVKGAPLFTLDSESERAAQAEATARVDSARAQAANTDKGRRAEEIAVTQAQYNQAQAAATLARNELARQQQLVSQGFVAKARVEDATTVLNQTQARVAELGAALQVAKLPARLDERSAAQAGTSAAVASLQQMQWRTAQKQQTAPAAAVVAETFFRAGELVPAGQAVVSLLPPENVKARFFVPEAQIATLAVGQLVQLLCDGCGTPIAARISRIATQPEYTPPVIYSNAQRAKLVFMVEARTNAADAPRLRPGQPLDVRLASASMATAAPSTPSSAGKQP
jgi:HlyD family secretion protein